MNLPSKRAYIIIATIFLACCHKPDAVQLGNGDIKLKEHIATIQNAKYFTYDKWEGISNQKKSDCWEAWVAILEHKDGARIFLQLYEEASNGETKLYALCGLYFCSYKEFQRIMALLRRAPFQGKVTVIDGDTESVLDARLLIECTGYPAEPARLWYGESLTDFVARKGKLQFLDIYGGGIPARLLDESWLDRRSAIDFESSESSDEQQGINIIKARERFYRRWRDAIENQK